MTAKKTFYITTSIAYANAAPHIGFALELIQADVLARWHRLQNKQVFLLTGTDEHGLKNARAAQKAGLEPQIFVNKNATQFESLAKKLNISYNAFIRTTDQKQHWPGAVELWKRLQKKGDLVKKNYRGLYCVGHEAFIQPHELVNGLCPDHQTKPELIEEENYFFLLSKYQTALRKLIESNGIKIIPEHRTNELLALIEQGLPDVSFSRPRSTLSWGIPVPGDPDQTMYVWCDALTNYISALGFGKKKKVLFNKFWPADVHLIGKDILRFHALYWPAMLLSAGLEPPKAIYVHGFITAEGQKMSKTIGNVVDPFALIKQYGTDPLRYFLIRGIPSSDDGDYKSSAFVQRYEDDLAKGLGNLVQRITKLAEGVSFRAGDKLTSPLQKALRNTEKTIDRSIENFQLHMALSSLWQLWKVLDETLEHDQPWALAPGSPERKKTLEPIIACLAQATPLLEPFLPETTVKIKRRLGESKSGYRPVHGEVIFPPLRLF